MNPVVSLDVAKGESQVQAFLDKKKPYNSSFKVALREIENITGIKTSYRF